MTGIRGTGLTQPGTQTHDYAWRGEPEPPAVTEARERYRAHEAERERMQAQVNTRLDALATGHDPDRCGCCGRFITAAGHGEACDE